MQLGLIGLGTMGANLARNAARNGADVFVFNRTSEKTDAFIKDYAKEGSLEAVYSLAGLCKTLKSPRVIILMVKAGDAVNACISEVLPHLSKGDILIDGGNSHYRHTERRQEELEQKGIHLLGMGISGGEVGALEGPSMMPGGDKSAYEKIEPLFIKMAADDGSASLTTGGAGGKCFTYVGPGGSGHYVKMVHNGIEYGIMQLIAEAYHVLKVEGGLSNEDLGKIFAEWSASDDLRSFLMEITAKVFKKKESGKFVLDQIKDAAGQKGTGKWTTDAAMEYGVAVPTITAAVDARIMSSTKEFRVMRSGIAPVSVEEDSLPKEVLPDIVRSALELSIINTYAQGMQMLSVANAKEDWQMQTSEVARIWRGGCIIRSAILEHYQKAFEGDKAASEHLRERCSGDRQLEWRHVVALGAERGIPLPAMSASLSYYDSYRSAWLPQNLVQAQRDFFGAHGYEKLDEEGNFHTNWNL
ncbi:hypothetical protein A3D88_02740 [Candidatus Peribacteria bacterium RIFCSPHIGHO2_02_FULL_52_16]|nr:MAG: hypothetical protein A2706_00565 [Candidatus Peribacteria bacterium RIFCSPHIGHO2_01_FULL_51_35]OGJ61676.1 MAG: hypothetical protein A3D88_02740 [Candidatus Peribacteria bacterium RIFCSPHIGHO2_02_FULL_52_16]